MKVKVTCPNCQEKSIPTDIDGNGITVLAIPEQDTSHDNTLHASENDNTCANEAYRATEEQIDDVLKAREKFHSRVRPSLFRPLMKFFSENPVFEFNTILLGVWASLILGASNNSNGVVQEIIDLFSGFTIGITGIITSGLLLIILMIPGGILGWIKEEKIQKESLKYLFGSTKNLISFALVLFIGFSVAGDYSNIQRKDAFSLGQQKTKVLLALHENDCKLAKEHYQAYKESRGSDHPALSASIQNCLID